jgi:hypothetical protein
MHTSCTNAYAAPYAATPLAIQNSVVNDPSDATRKSANPTAAKQTGNQSLRSNVAWGGAWWL